MANSRYTSATSGSAQSLLVDIRASTRAFAQDITAMRSSLDGTLVTGFTQAGSTLQTGLVSAITKGVDAFTTLRGTALSVISDIAAQATSSLFAGGGGAGSPSGLLGLGALTQSLTGLPGRATGGAVSPGQSYVVGERGPELFVPTAAGAIAASQSAAPRDVRVSININAPAGTDAPQALQRSGRQIASVLRRALAQN